jgi:hypothetical protein
MSDLPPIVPPSPIEDPQHPEPGPDLPPTPIELPPEPLPPNGQPGDLPEPAIA